MAINLGPGCTDCCTSGGGSSHPTGAPSLVVLAGAGTVLSQARRRRQILHFLTDADWFGKRVEEGGVGVGMSPL